MLKALSWSKCSVKFLMYRQSARLKSNHQITGILRDESFFDSQVHFWTFDPALQHKIAVLRNNSSSNVSYSIFFHLRTVMSYRNVFSYLRKLALDLYFVVVTSWWYHLVHVS